jgi:hypothetical protein
MVTSLGCYFWRNTQKHDYTQEIHTLGEFFARLSNNDWINQFRDWISQFGNSI